MSRTQSGAMLLLALALVWAAILLMARHGLRAGWGRGGAAAAGLGVFAAGALVATDPVSQKVAGQLMMATGILLAALGAWTSAAAVLGRRKLAFGLGGLFVAYSLAGNVLVGNALLRAVESTVDAADWRTAPPFDAALVLGGGTKAGPRPGTYELGCAGDRVAAAARMFHRGRAEVLVTSGRGVPGLSEEDLTAATSRIWMDLGVPESAIERLPDPYNTKMEMEAYARLLAERGWARVALVTSAAHLPRAMGHARRLGLDVVPVAADRTAPVHGWSALYIVPSARGFQDVERAWWETLGALVGR